MYDVDNIRRNTEDETNKMKKIIYLQESVSSGGKKISTKRSRVKGSKVLFEEEFKEPRVD